MGGKSAITPFPLAGGAAVAWASLVRRYDPVDAPPLADELLVPGSAARGSVVMGGKMVNADSNDCPSCVRSMEKVVLRRLNGFPEGIEGVEREEGVGRRFKWD